MGNITKKSVAGMTKEQWLQARAGTIGGSEISSVLGMNPYKSAYALWAQKSGKLPPFEGNTATRVGTKMEQCVAELFEQDSGMKVKRTNFLWYNDDFPHQHALPDRLIEGRKAGLEIKTTSAFNGKSFRDEEFPANYYVQCVQYMAVMEYPEWFLAVLIGNSDFRIYHLVRNHLIETPAWCKARVYVPQEDIDTMQRKADEFNTAVATGKPPVPDGSEASTDAVTAVWDEQHDDGINLIGMENLADEYELLSKSIKEQKNRQEEIKNILCDSLMGCTTGFVGTHRVTWKDSERKTFDTLSAVADYPELVKYYKTSTSRTFRFK